MRTAVFASSGRGPRRWRASFNEPRAVHIAHTPAEVCSLVTVAEQAALAGRWVAVVLTYEAATAFDPAIRTHRLTTLPLAWAAEFDDLSSSPDLAYPAAYEIAAWQPLIAKADYTAAIAQIH